MDCTLVGAGVYYNGKFTISNIFVSNGIILAVSPFFIPRGKVFDFSGCVIIPGLVDVHVHLREPGFSYKETIASGTGAAAHGGYTDICSMPNLVPPPDCRENISVQMDIIKDSALIKVYPYGTITRNQAGILLSDMEKMQDLAIAFSDDGRGVQNEDMMRLAMLEAKKYDKIIAAHCEDNSLLCGGYINDGEYAHKMGHKGICSKSEWKQIERDLGLAKETGCKYHVCHISTEKSVDLIRRAKSEGVDVTCETAPHYLTLTDNDLQEDGRFKMNPPLRSEKDRLALIEGIKDGTIDMIATDHAPHSLEEKSKGLKESLMGVVGLETAFSVLYTHLVKTGIITLENLISLMHSNPCSRFGIKAPFKIYSPANFTVYDLNDEYTINSSSFLSKGKSTPFEGMKVTGRCRMTVCRGKVVWQI